MKVKTSITLSEGVISALDDLQSEFKNRSEAIEQAIRFYLRNRRHRLRENRDLKILNKKSAYLNREAEDVLTYQVDL